jgi:peptide-methionine (S)-S-oxide reductase
MEELFRQLPGVTDTHVGYTGGSFKNPTYPDMKTGATGHAEALKITFDPAKLSYEALLEFFFKIHDPTTPDRQGNDRGSQYRSLICYLNDTQKAVAQKVIDRANASGKWPSKIVTQLQPAGEFYDAESYHQDYLQKNPGGYTCHYIRPDWVL